MITEIAKIDEVRKRRSDPEFKDIKRYVRDMKYILNAMNEKHKKILDIGAGAGVFSITLAHLGFDVTATNLITEESQESREIQFFRQFKCAFVPTNLDEQGLPFSNNVFDAIICLHVIEHLKKPFNLLAEIKRVLKPSGTLILMTPNGTITSIYKRLLHTRIHHDDDHVREYTPKEIVYMLTFSGLKVRNLQYSNEMVSARLLGMTQGIKWLLVRGYCLLCNLLPAIGYEIHATAKLEHSDA